MHEQDMLDRVRALRQRTQQSTNGMPPMEPGMPGYENLAPPPEPDDEVQVLDLNGHPIRMENGTRRHVYESKTVPGDVAGMATWITYGQTPGSVMLSVVDRGRTVCVSATITRRVALEILPVLQALGDVLDLTGGGLTRAETGPHLEAADRPDRGSLEKSAPERTDEPDVAPADGGPPPGGRRRRGGCVPKLTSG